MTHRIERWARALGLILLCGCQTLPNDVESVHRFTGALGAAWTGDLQEPRTSKTNAAVDPWAFAWQLGYEYVPVGQDGPVEFGLALDFSSAVGDVDSSRTSAGFLVSEEGGSMTWNRFTPGVTARFPVGSQDLLSRSLVASAGVGYYGIEVEATQSSVIFPVVGSRELFDDEGFGGFVGLGYESMVPGRGGVFVEAEVHFFDFDPGPQYPSGTGAVRGPLVTLWMGFVAAF
jgi:hypothetical protein